MLVDLRSITKVIRGAWRALLFILLFVALISVGRALYPIKFRKAVDECAREFNLDPSLVYAVIRVESGFDPRATSAAGASGLMQIMPRTGSWVASQLGIPITEQALLEPETNIRIGSFYLRYLLDWFDGDPVTALAAYNAGLRNVENWLEEGGKRRLDRGDIQFVETRQFIERVVRDRKIYRLFYPRYLRG